jgi:hypothetical protein
MLFVIVTVVMISGDVQFMFTDKVFETLVQCRSELSQGYKPNSVCAEVPISYLFIDPNGGQDQT